MGVLREGQARVFVFEKENRLHADISIQAMLLYFIARLIVGHGHGALDRWPWGQCR